MSILVAMHAPNGNCRIEIEGGSFGLFQISPGELKDWRIVEMSANAVELSNDKAQHISFRLKWEADPLSGGCIKASVSGTASMWAIVEGQPRVLVSTNPGQPRREDVFCWFGLTEYAKPHDEAEAAT